MHLATALELAADRYPDIDAIVTPSARFSYGEWNRRINSVSWGLKNAGVGPGDRVAICAQNGEAPATAAHTISMCIHPDFRRRGLGKLIQQTADGIAKGLGAYWFTGEVRVSNTAQIKMLEGLGWETVGVCPNFFKNGETAVVMWNRLCK